MTPTLIFGSDHAGFNLKQELINYAKDILQLNVMDLGPQDDQVSDYPVYAHKVAKLMEQIPNAWGCLICGTGIGMCMTVNRYPYIRGAVANDSINTVKIARAHNNANVLCLGARIITPEYACEALAAFMNTPFEEGRHQVRIDMINQCKD